MTESKSDENSDASDHANAFDSRRLDISDKVDFIVKQEGLMAKSGRNKNLTFKIVLMGDKYVGKTSIVNRYVHGGFNSHYNYTGGGDIYYKTISVGNRVINLKLIDTAGQFDQKSIIKSLYRNAHGIMIVFDVTNERSFNDVDGWVHQVLTTVGDSNPQMLLVGNKTDLGSARKHIHENHVKKKASRHGLRYSIVSARMDTNITDVFDVMVHSIVNSQVEQKTLYLKGTDSFYLSTQKSHEKVERSFCGC